MSNAALVGAKTVNGPGPDSVSTRPAALTAATSVVWSFELTAFSMMFLLGYMGAPPTILAISAKAGATNVGAASATLAASAAANSGILAFMGGLSVCSGRSK